MCVCVCVCVCVGGGGGGCYKRQFLCLYFYLGNILAHGHSSQLFLNNTIHLQFTAKLYSVSSMISLAKKCRFFFFFFFFFNYKDTKVSTLLATPCWR